MDVIWAFPVILLGIALGTAFALGGLKLGPIKIGGDSKLIPILIIAVVYIPYMARPIRGQVLALREREFVEAARAQGAGPLRLMFSEILPNLSSTIVVFFPLMVANAILLEAALGFVGVGVRPPEPVVGHDDQRRRGAHPHRPPPGDRAGHDAGAHRPGAERVRRRRARRLDPRATVQLER